MEKEEKNQHAEHRLRVRRRFLSAGLEGFPAHNVLELLLFYSIPQRDTNDLAHRLIDEFGSLAGVFDADFNDLLKVNGVGENTAVLLKLIPQLSKRILSEKASEGLYLSESEELSAYISAQFIGAVSEEVRLLCLDNTGKLINCCVVSSGAKNSANLDGRTILEAVFRNNATSVILAHNHPNGVAAPSKSDIDFTLRLLSLLRGVDVKLADHVIVAGNDVFSMAASPLFGKYFA